MSAAMYRRHWRTGVRVPTSPAGLAIPAQQSRLRWSISCEASVCVEPGAEGVKPAAGAIVRFVLTFPNGM